MKTICPFCQKELSRIERIKYHLEHSVCISNVEEKEEMIKVINMDMSMLLHYTLLQFRGMKEKDDVDAKNLSLQTENLQLKKQIEFLEKGMIGWIKLSESNKSSDTITHIKEYEHHDNSTTSIDNSKVDNSTTSIDNSKVDNSTTSIDNSSNSHNTITVNLFENENISYIHVPNYLTHQDDIVKLVKDVHFHPDHPENHNVRITEKDAKIYRKNHRKNKIGWEKFSQQDAFSELIQNGETILSSYGKALTPDENKIQKEISHIVGRETYSNCFTEKLIHSIREWVRIAKEKPVNSNDNK